MSNDESRFTGPQHKGAMRLVREVKRQEAEARQASVLHERTRAHREGRCSILHAIFEGGAA